MHDNRFKLSDFIIIRQAGWMWLAYMVALMGVDFLFFRIGPPQRISSYYIANILAAVIFISLSFWENALKKYSNLMTIGFILLISILPIAMNHIIAPRMLPGPMSNVEGMALRVIPILFIGLVLTAWRFTFVEVSLYSIGIAFLDMIIVLVLVRNRLQTLQVFALINLVRTVSFLTIGFFIRSMMVQINRQQNDLRISNEKLTRYSQTLEELTISRERNRLARELHDTLAHSLTALSVQLETVKAYWQVDAGKAKQLLDRSLNITREGAENTRRALQSLRASPLDDLGLILAVKQLVQSVQDRAGIKTNIHLPPEISSLNNEEQHAVYRIIQEALENVIKHARAASLIVKMEENGRKFCMTIIDDGIGIGKEKNQESGFGIIGMQERANLIGGNLEIISKKGKGSSIIFKLQKDGNENNHM